jgi:hypothetical protein
MYICHYLSTGDSIVRVQRKFPECRLQMETVSRVLRALQVKMLSILREDYRPTFTPWDTLEIDEMWMDWTDWDNQVGSKHTEEAREKREKERERGQWVIGMVNRERTKLWIECIPNRRRSSIQAVVDPLLRQWLLRKPRIHTDALKSYEYLAAANTHYVINKVRDGFGIESTTFWGRTVKVNVNAIENVWRQLRQLLRARNAYTAPQHTQLHIAEFMYNWYRLSWADLLKV